MWNVEFFTGFCCSDGEHSIAANSMTLSSQEIFKCTGKCIKALRYRICCINLLHIAIDCLSERIQQTKVQREGERSVGSSLARTEVERALKRTYSADNCEEKW
jgi:hypothetical protein